MTHHTWKQGDPLDRKREVWDIHVETGLDDTARAIIEAFGVPEAIAIRRHENYVREQQP